MSKENPLPQFNFQIELSLLKDLHSSIKTQEVVVSKESGYLKKLREEETDKLKPIQEKIKNGEASTDNKIKDFTIVYFDNSEEKENQLRNLESQLKEHKGEFVLLKTIESEAHGHIDFGSSSREPHPELYHWEEKARIGIINEKKPLDLDVKTGKIIISSKNCYLINKFRDSKFFSQGESVSIPSWGLNILGKSLESVYSNQSYLAFKKIKSQGIEDAAMEIIVGDERVSSYLNYNESVFVEVAKKLGREVIIK